MFLLSRSWGYPLVTQFVDVYNCKVLPRPNNASDIIIDNGPNQTNSAGLGPLNVHAYTFINRSIPKVKLTYIRHHTNLFRLLNSAHLFAFLLFSLLQLTQNIWYH